MDTFFDLLFNIDLRIFHFINDTLSSEFIDVVLPYVSHIHNMSVFKFGIGPVLLVVWFYRQKKRALRVLVALLMTVGLADTLAYRVIKPSIQRLRPNNNPDISGNLKLYGPKSYSFPSNHATNGMAAAYVLSWYYPGGRMIIFGLAIIVGLSRVYAGVHFPSDVLAGWLLGFLIGFALKELIFRQISFFSSSRRIR